MWISLELGEFLSKFKILRVFGIPLFLRKYFLIRNEFKENNFIRLNFYRNKSKNKLNNRRLFKIRNSIGFEKVFGDFAKNFIKQEYIVIIY